MKQNSTATITEVPLHILLRRRREELSLYQAEIAETLNVTAECIGQWESGRRRMELGRDRPDPDYRWHALLDRRTRPTGKPPNRIPR